MRRRMATISILALLVLPSLCQGGLTMHVHDGATTTDFLVAGVDSVTFSDRPFREMVTVPAGTFTMGDGEAYCGEDEREVTFTRDFYLGQHEVTNHEYMDAVQWAYDHGYVTATTSSVMDAMDGSTQELLDLDSNFCEVSFSGGVFTVDAGREHHPVIEVTWYGAARYCDWLSMMEGLPRAYEHSGDWLCNNHDPYGAAGYRLPTDAEWEYAAQYDDERIYPWGNEAPSCARANYLGCVGWTSPVGSYPDAPAAVGLWDMAGNVSEWCNDWHVCSLGTATVSDPVGPTSGYSRVVRGSSWNYNHLALPCAWRSAIPPDYSNREYGFRVARTVNPSAPEMVIVPAGTFTMGDGEAYCGEAEREVTLTGHFYLGQREVTNQEYMGAVQWAYDHGYVTATTSSVMDAMDGSLQELLDLDDPGCEIQFESGTETFYLRESPSLLAQNAYPEGYDPADHPAKEVTWYGAARYCDWLSLQAGLPRAYQHSGEWLCNGHDPTQAQGYRLPTDAEWECAARYDDDRIYPWGNESPDCSRTNFYDGHYCVGWTAPVGSYPDAPAALGLSDMAGNLSEWCNDWHVCDLGASPVTDPVGPESGTDRVIRGDPWFYVGGSSHLRSACRHYGSPNSSGFGVGFRIARTVDP